MPDTTKPIAVERTIMLYPEDLEVVAALAAQRFEGKISMALRHIIRSYAQAQAGNGAQDVTP